MRSHPLTRVLEEDPELGDGIGPGRLAPAAQAAVAATFSHERGEWLRESWPEPVQRGPGLLLLEGLVIRRIGLDGRFAIELLAPGDLLRPWQLEDAASSIGQTSAWKVLQRCRIAVLDLAFSRRIAPFPEIGAALVGRAVRRSRHLGVNMAIVQQPRVEKRLSLLLWHLADRWGRVRVDGVLIELGLTHAILAELLAARRPTVTAALAALEDHGLVSRSDDGLILHGPPPNELVELAGSDAVVAAVE